MITGLSTGGAELSLYRLLTAMDRERFRSTVLSLSGGGPVGEQIAQLGVPVRSLDLSFGAGAAAGIVRLSRILAEERPDLVQAWMYHANLFATVAARFSRRSVPVLWNVRASLDGLENEKRSTRVIVRIGAWLSRSPEGIAYNSGTSARQHAAIGYSAAHARVISNGFDCSLFKADILAGARLRACLRLPPESVLVGCIGRYHPIKGHDTLLAAAARAVRVDPRLRFLLVGTNMDSRNVRLVSLISSLGLDRFVHCLGERNDIPAVAAGLDIACSASVGESFPNAIGEAMASGVPCIATDTGDSRALVGTAGCIVPTKDPAALAAAMLSLARMDRDERRALGEVARERIEQHYSLAAIASRYESWYEQVAS